MSVTDTGGEVTTASTLVTVEERVISVTLTANPVNPAVGASVTFTATASGTNIVTYDWNFGDGATRVTTGPTTNHAYGSSGRKIVTLEVVNAVGQRGIQTVEVLVQ